MNLKLSPLYPIIDPQISSFAIRQLLIELAYAGVTLVQLREKNTFSKRFFEAALELVEFSKLHGITILINDRVDIAVLSGAQGVHLGQQDLPVADARKILGPDRIIGLSTHNLQQALKGQESEANYIAIGPVYTTVSKENPDPIVEWKELLEIRKKVTKPLVAIGGITIENAKPLFDMGVDSVAVIRDVLKASEIQARLRQYFELAGRY